MLMAVDAFTCACVDHSDLGTIRWPRRTQLEPTRRRVLVSAPFRRVASRRFCCFVVPYLATDLLYLRRVRRLLSLPAALSAGRAVVGSRPRSEKGSDKTSWTNEKRYKHTAYLNTATNTATKTRFSAPKVPCRSDYQCRVRASPLTFISVCLSAAMTVCCGSFKM